MGTGSTRRWQTGRITRLAFACAVLAAGGYAESQVVVVTSSSVPAYREAVDGFTSLLPDATVLELEAAGRAAALKPRLIVAVGSRAVEQLADTPVPVISTMLLQGAQGRNRTTAGTVSLDVPLASVLPEIRRVCPAMTRIAVLTSAARLWAAKAELVAQARRMGFTLEFAACADAKELLEAVASLRDRVDAAWCAPDGALFNATTVQPLVLASLRHRVPLVGFSESFVKAGAALGVYPDFRDVGLQTAELAQRYLSSPALGGRETARALRVTINEQVMRLLGLKYTAPRGGDARTVVLR